MRVFASVVLLLVSVNLEAANRYVRSAASGANNGTSWTDAYTSMPTPSRGNTYYVAEGNYTNWIFTTAESGTTPIIIRKATPADHGTSTGWDDTYGDEPVLIYDGIDFGSDYWYFDGATRTGWTTGYGFRIIHDGIGIHIYNTACNVTVTNVEVRGHGPDGGQGWERNCNVYGSDDSTNLVFTSCLMTNSGAQPFFLPNVDYCVITNCWVANNENYNGDPEQHAEGTYISTGIGDVVCNSIWVDIEGTGVIMIAGSNHKVFGNLIYFTGDINVSNGTIAGWSGFNLVDSVIYNNTVIIPAGGSLDKTVGFANWTTVSGSYAYNNLIYVEGSRADWGFHASLTHDYNWFYGAGSQSETHIQNGSGDPFTDLAGYDFTLTADTTAGTDVGSEYSVDMNGVTRSTWTRGAFQYSGAYNGPVYCVGPSATGDGSGSDWTNLMAFNTSSSAYSKGDTFLLVDGTYPNPSIEDAVSGSGVFTIQKATVANHGGIEAGWDNSYGDGDAEFNSIFTYTGDLVIDGVKIQLATPTIAPTIGFQIDSGSSVTNVTLANCTIIGPVDTFYYGYYSIGIDSMPTSDNHVDITITNCIIKDCTVLVQNTNSIRFTLDHCFLANSLAYDVAQNPAVFSVGSGQDTVIRNCTVSNWVGVGVNPIGAGSGTNLIYGNYFVDIASGSTQGAFTPESSATGLWRGYNNTLKDTRYGILNDGSLSGGFTNNLFYGTATNNNFGSFSHDYNWYGFGGKYSEANGVAGGDATDPFNTAPNIVTDISAVLPRNKGVAMPAPYNAAPYNIDMNGNTRGADGAWDIGAVEAVGGGGILPLHKVWTGLSISNSARFTSVEL